MDKYGNVIDNRGNLMFEKAILDKDGDIPPVFRTGLLGSDSGSDISRLHSNIDDRKPVRDNDGETSMDSNMADTPANYNNQNQRFEDKKPDIIPEDDENNEHMARSEYDDEDDRQDDQ